MPNFQLVKVVRNPVEGVLRHRQPFRPQLPSGHLDVDAVKLYLGNAPLRPCSLSQEG